jgi:hypothetical protein
LFDGQIFDAYSFALDLIKSTKKRMALIGSHIDDSALVLIFEACRKCTGNPCYVMKITPL